MKKAVFGLIALGFCASLNAESLSTTDGATYDNITMKRADPDGLYIEYKLSGGGTGMSKVKFNRLSAEQQKQCGFDAGKAKDFESKVAKATDDLRQESTRLEQAAQVQRAARQARELEEERIQNDRLQAAAQLAQAQGNNNGGGSFVGGYYYSSVGLYRVAKPIRSSSTNHNVNNGHGIYPGAPFNNVPANFPQHVKK